MRLKTWLVRITAAVGLCFGAFISAGNAAVVVGDEGTLQNGIDGFSNGVGIGATVDEIWEFDLTSNKSLTVSLENSNQIAGANLSSLELQTWSDPNGTPDSGDETQIFGTFLSGVNDFSPSQGILCAAQACGSNITSVFAYFALVPGQYYFRILATADGAAGGTYDVDYNVVPLPPAIWLLLSALVGLVSFARIRRGGAPTSLYAL